MQWIRISTKAQLEFPYKLSKSKLSLQDLLIDLDEVTELTSSSIFEFKSDAVRAEERYPELIVGLSFEVDLDQTVI